MNNRQLPPMIVMGVSGSGKTTLGTRLGEALGVPFIDSDDLHPAANKEKMRAGQPLNDDDRRPWLHLIGAYIKERTAAEETAIVACSALKRSYRDLLRRHAPDLVFIHLTGHRDTIAERLGQRRHEYMPATLLDSQLHTLEPLHPDETSVVIDVSGTPQAMVIQVLSELQSPTK
ncbi:gluconokinase [Arthrobacter sp. GCM10027362]|uniref:gluconokinase n=1 Tax=Arthrobacter sp. GCM10027362 TaxID=3273379 RepID=UPI003645F34D